jgi:hypothetical protein
MTTTALIRRLVELIAHRDRFTFDLRGECVVHSGVVAAYAATQRSERPLDLPGVIMHAHAHEGIIGAWRTPEGTVQYDSCRLFTSVDQAVHFARIEGQRSVYHIDRQREVEVPVVGAYER